MTLGLTSVLSVRQGLAPAPSPRASPPLRPRQEDRDQWEEDIEQTESVSDTRAS
jgi:hypothetical protein